VNFVSQLRRTLLCSVVSAIFFTTAVAIGPVDAPEAAGWNFMLEVAEGGAHLVREVVGDVYHATSGTEPDA